MVLPFIIGGIGAAVGATVGAVTTHAAGEKDREKAKYHRKIANELSEKYAALQRKYNELEDKNQKQIQDLTRQAALDEIEKDGLRLALRLQQNLLSLMQAIDSEPSTLTLNNFREAVDVTNKVLDQLNEELIVVSVDYWNQNLIRAQEREYLGGFRKSKQGFELSNKSSFFQEYSYSESQNKHSINYNKMENNTLNSSSVRIIELAKQGNAEAVTEILNYLLITDEIETKSFYDLGVIEVIVKGKKIPTSDKLIQRIGQIIEHLQLKFISKVKIYAQDGITKSLTWYQEFEPVKKNSFT
ncbi:MAG: hypothetical protein AAGJ08_10940 [Cyanobacteria bacterium P01_H01_bin.35]